MFVLGFSFCAWINNQLPPATACGFWNSVHTDSFDRGLESQGPFIYNTLWNKGFNVINVGHGWDHTTEWMLLTYVFIISSLNCELPMEIKFFKFLILLLMKTNILQHFIIIFKHAAVLKEFDINTHKPITKILTTIDLFSTALLGFNFHDHSIHQF